MRGRARAGADALPRDLRTIHRRKREIVIAGVEVGKEIGSPTGRNLDPDLMPLLEEIGGIAPEFYPIGQHFARLYRAQL